MTDPEPVHSVRLNGVECEVIDAADVDTMGDESDECSAPADRHWRYCCGNLLSSPPPSLPPPAIPQYPNAPLSQLPPSPANRSEFSISSAPTLPPSLDPGRSQSAAWYERRNP